MNKPEFNDVFAKTSRTRHNKFDGYVVEILYGAKDAEGNPCAPQADADDGHGRWYGIDVNGDYTLLNMEQNMKTRLWKSWRISCSRSVICA